MRALNAQFELFDTADVPVGDWNGGMQQGSKLPGWGSALKYKNSGNKAKKYLKTNDITFFEAANRAHFTRNFAQIECCTEQEPRVLRKTKLRLRSGQARKEGDKKSSTWPTDLTASVRSPLRPESPAPPTAPIRPQANSSKSTLSGARTASCARATQGDTVRTRRLAPNRDSQGLHFSIEVAALESQSFGRARDVALIFLEFAEDVVALVGGSRLLQ